MKILITLSETVYFFQKNIVQQLSIKEGMVVFILKSGNDFIVPEFTKLQKALDFRFTNYETSPFEEVSWEDLLNLEGVKIYHNEPIDLHLNLSGFPLEKEEKSPVISPVLDMQHWMDQGKVPGSETVISLKSETGSVINTLSFSSDQGVFNNTCKALFYMPYLIVKTIAGERNTTVDNPSTFRPGKAFYTAQLLKIIKRKFSRSELNWKLAVRQQDRFFQVLNPQKNSFWADPFLIVDGGKTYVFFEELKPENSNGQISCVEIDESGLARNKTEVLKKDFHLSFPNVFSHDGSYWMLPEQSESGSLNLYKAVQFPHQWEHGTTLMENVKIIDPEIIFYEERYWLFCNVLEDYEHENNERLSIFYSDDLFSGKWTPHAQNPVVISKEHARNAGKIIFENGKMLRPAQSCLKNYGESLSLRTIIELTPETYTEKQVISIEPPEGYVGLHTYNKTSGMQIFDLLQKEKF